MSSGEGVIFTFGVIVAIAVVPVALWGCPQYNVYSQRLSGEAEYQKAEQNRKVTVLEAQAQLEANKLTAQAEVERAKGVAEANEIIADGLGGPEGYLRWRWIEMLENTGVKNQRDVIYLPSSGGIPIQEAGRLTGNPIGGLNATTQE